VMASQIPIQWSEPVYAVVAGNSAPPTVVSPKIGPSDEPDVTLARLSQQSVDGGDQEDKHSSATLVGNDLKSENWSNPGEGPTSHRNHVTLQEIDGRCPDEQELIEDGESISRTSAIHWATPVNMVGSLLLGVFCSIGHHLYHNYLVGRNAGDNFQQLWIRG